MKYKQRYENDFSTKEEENEFNINNKFSKMENDFEKKNNNNKIEEITTDPNESAPQSTGIRRGFGKYMRRLIFILIFLVNVLINFDHGAIPAGTTILMKELNIDSMLLGIIGSVVYLGLTIGASTAGFLFNNYAPKWIVTLSIGSSCFFLYSFTQATSPFSILVVRFFCGYCQIFCLIYFPVWVDQFGIYENRTIWLSFLQLGVPLGTMLGYVLEAFSIRQFSNWKIAFYVQFILLAIAVIILALTPDKFFSKNYKRTDITRILKKQLLENNGNLNSDDWKENIGISGPKYNRLSDFSIYSLKDEDENNKETNYLQILNQLASNKIYAFTMLSICCLLFIITGIQFWITDYMKIIMHVNEKTVYITFSVVCITAPTLGVLSGGYLIEKLGGYTDKRALLACYKISMLAAVSGLPLPLINYYPIFVLLMWLTLFFGGSIVPGLTGIMLSSVPENYKEIANSHTHFCYNLIGYLPAPFLYGLVCSYTGGSNSKWGLAFLMSISILGVLFLYFAKQHQNSDEDDIYKKETSSLFESYQKHKNVVNASNTNTSIKAEAITALYGRISLTK